MAARALIIAIEDYPQAEAGMMEKKLPGVIDTALKFRTWLEDKWKAEGNTDTQLIFCSEPKQPGGRGASWTEIVAALEQLKTDGQGMTGELFFYFSGHGFRFEESPGSLTDVLVASDFVKRGNLCIKLDEIVRWLRSHLGMGRHYYFIDACRNVLDRSKMQVSDAMEWDPNVSGEATCYVLQSTVSGSPALVAGPFAESLLGGLKGESRAKVWADNLMEGMMVRYDSLRTYLKKKLARDQPITSNVNGEEGENDAVFAILNPPDPSTLNVEVQDLDPGDKATMTLTRLRTLAKEVKTVTDKVSMTCAPDNYLLEITVPGVTLQPSGMQEVDLYESPKDLVFKAVYSEFESATPSPPPEPVETESAVDLEVPDGTTMEIRGIDTGESLSAYTSKSVTLPHGRYETILKSRSGTTLKQDSLDLTAETAAEFEGPELLGSAPHAEIARQLPTFGNNPAFSESLGAGMEDPDLNLWLTILGGGRIIGSNGSYSKIQQFQLQDFSGMAPGTSGLYVLAGFPDPNRTLRASMGPPDRVNWATANPPPDLPSSRELFFDANPGQDFLSLHVEGVEPLTLATCHLPNRVTLVVLTLDEEGAPVVHQFILPLGHLVSSMDPDIQAMLQSRNHLQDLKFLAQASRAFGKRRKLREQFSGDELQDLLYGKWLDPVGAALAAYENIRRGEKSELGQVIDNLKRYFPEFPDGPAIAKMAGKTAEPNGVPLFLDGWLAIRKHEKAPEPPGPTLDYSSALTTWLGAASK